MLLILDYIQIISNNQIENSKSWASFEIESSIIKMNGTMDTLNK